MALTQDSIPNFIGGVSQQPDKLMFQNCSKELINYIPSPTQGLIKRPPTEYKHELMAKTFTKYPKIHVVNNENGQYYIVLDGEDIKVFNSSGVEQTVTIQDTIQNAYIDDVYGIYCVKEKTITNGAVSYTGNYYTKIVGHKNRKCLSTVYTTVACTETAPTTQRTVGNITYTGEYYYTGGYETTEQYQVTVSWLSYSISEQGVYYQPNIKVSAKKVLGFEEDDTPILDNTTIDIGISEAGAYIVATDEVVSSKLDLGRYLAGDYMGFEGDLGSIAEWQTPDFGKEAIKTVCTVQSTHHLTATDIVTVSNYQGLIPEHYYNPSPSLYIQAENPLTQLDMTTIGNYTFILNKTKKTAMLSDLPLNPYKNALLVFVKQADYAITYNVEIDGKKAKYTTHASDNTKVTTEKVREGLVSSLKTKLGSRWADTYTIKESGSCFVIYKNNNAEMKISVSDSNGNRNLYGFYNTADALENLPLTAPNNYVLKLLGEGASSDDDYYVRFITADGTEFSNGNWEECGSPDLPYLIDISTMPHILEYTANGFVFRAGDYTGRRAGDEESAKTPSFIGNTIQEVFAHKGRIGFLSNDKSIYSDTEDVFAFFKKTTLTKLDTDPIDLGSNSKLALLKHGLQYNTNLLLFSPTSIFQIQGGDVFSNSTVTMDLIMEYPCSPVCKPIAIGDNGLYVANRGNYSTVYELYLDSYATVNSRQLTEALPTYIPKNVFKIAGNIQNNIACFLTSEEPNNIYVYNFYYSNEQKAQSAWCKWNFGDTNVLYADFIDSNLLLFTYFDNKLHLEIMDCSPKQTDEDLNFNICLDKKIKLSGVYDGENTTYTLPYNSPEDVVVIDENGFSHYYTKTPNTSNIVVDGEIGDVYVGQPYLSTWTLPTIYKKQQTQNGNQKTVEGLLMLKDINLSYSDTGYFRVKVIPHYTALEQSNYDYASVFTQNDYERDPHEFENQNNMLGTPTATLGVVSVHNGTMLIPIMMKNEEITIQILNDSYLPCCFNSLLWLGNLCIRGQKS